MQGVGLCYSPSRVKLRLDNVFSTLLRSSALMSANIPFCHGLFAWALATREHCARNYKTCTKIRARWLRRTAARYSFHFVYLTASCQLQQLRTALEAEAAGGHAIVSLIRLAPFWNGARVLLYIKTPLTFHIIIRGFPFRTTPPALTVGLFSVCLHAFLCLRFSRLWISWYMAPCILVEWYQRFGETYCLHLQSRS